MPATADVNKEETKDSELLSSKTDASKQNTSNQANETPVKVEPKEDDIIHDSDFEEPSGKILIV